MKVSFADEVRLGPQAAGVKRKLKPKQWRKIVKAAHKQGYTVSGALSGAPNALKERTRKSLVQEATSTVNKAYKPQETELSRQQLRASAIADKRRNDNLLYQTWLKGETEKLQAQARAADTAMLTRQQEIAQTAIQGWNDAKAQAQANAAAVPGTISDVSQSTPLNQGLDAAAQKSAQMVANQRQQSADMVGSTERTALYTTAAQHANAAAMGAQIEGTISADQAKLDQLAAQIKASKTGDLQKAVTAALQNEQTKANANRDYQAAAASLGVKQDQINLDLLKEKHRYGLDRAKLNLEKWKTQNQALYQKAQIQLGYDRIKAQQGKAAADRALRKWIAKHKAQGGGRAGESASDAKASRKNYQTVETARQSIRDLYKRFPNGRTKNGKDFRQVLLSRGFDNVTLDLAFDLNKNRGKLSPAMKQKAQALLVGRYYPMV